eukprot:TRINITY_DN7740_c0_g1_i1.p1 TRINITY_DN7740_c0_g1~~TRINITY_DN7740_c0_g1_i1.p1  ORF type:complete len:231 (+),score=4.08 TRINITY_DN7740_c0_g1_i1:65-757(+)
MCIRDRLYTEVIKITKLMRNFHELHNHFDEAVAAPEYYTVDNDLNVKLEALFNSLNENGSSASPTSMRTRQIEPLKYVLSPKTVESFETRTTPKTIDGKMKRSVTEISSSARLPIIQFPPNLRGLEDYDQKLKALGFRAGSVQRRSDYFSTEPIHFESNERDVDEVPMDIVEFPRHIVKVKSSLTQRESNSKREYQQVTTVNDSFVTKSQRIEKQILVAEFTSSKSNRLR